MSNYRRLNLFAILSIVLLRLGVGWHFYMEGATKVKEGNFSSAGFLNAAKGPLADHFHQLVSDYDGRVRLGLGEDKKKLDDAMESFSNAVSTGYRFTDEQGLRASKVLKEAKERLAAAREQWAKEIREYENGFQRIEDLKNDKKYDDLASLRGQRDEIESKWKALPKPALGAIDKCIASLEKDLNEIATPAQVQSLGPKRFSLPGEPTLTTKMVDKIIPIFDMVIGILLILGLLTPVASIAAALFLTSVVLSQFPGYPGTQATYFQVVEVLACIALAATDAGRYAGLDYLSWTWWQVRKFDGWEPE